MSHYTKKDVQEPLLFDGGDEDTVDAHVDDPPAAKPAEEAVDDGVLTR